MRPCLPLEIQRAAVEAEKRRDEAIDMLLRELHTELPQGDPVENALRALIDADHAVVNLLETRRKP